MDLRTIHGNPTLQCTKCGNARTGTEIKLVYNLYVTCGFIFDYVISHNFNSEGPIPAI